MRVWCNYDTLAKMPVIGDPQFIDCNNKVVLMTKHPVFHKKFRCTNKMIERMRSTKLHNNCRGMHIVCNPKSSSKFTTPPYHIIFLDHLIHGHTKLLSTIVHEVSHLVDSLLEKSAVELVDTEIRAYMIDYYAEHIFSMMDFTFPTTKKEIKKSKLNAKS